jgi:putative AlgH/UPF0301 family transcriptional regulator
MLKRTPQAVRIYFLLAAFFIALPSAGKFFHPSLQGHLLVAPADLSGPFGDAVVYVVRHDVFHAHGFIINKPQPNAPMIDGQMVYYGGPVGSESYLNFSDITGERRPYMGYAGWGPLQLDYEVLRGSWHVLPADPDLLQTSPQTQWQKAISHIRKHQGVIAEGVL